MKTSNQARTCWLAVVVFALAMGWLEAATVYYLRVLVDRVEPYQSNPLPERAGLEEVELAREAATLVMLFTVGVLAARAWQTRLAYMAVAFGVWDISYYVFLKAMSGWPRSLLDWDILFLLPLPWWGPVLAPVSIAVLMIVWGTVLSQRMHPVSHASATRAAGLAGLGIALALYAFMADALHVMDEGVDAVRAVLPTTFNWPVFALALVLMAAPVAQVTWQRLAREESAAA
jgi:hypothetical protein